MKRKYTVLALLITLVAMLALTNTAMAKEGVITKMSDLPYLERESEQKVRSFSLDNNTEGTDNIVILYNTPQENNIENLGLTTDEVEAGRSVSDSVDVIKASDSVDTDDLIESIESNENVMAAARDSVRTQQAIPNDKYFQIQYYYARIGASKTWQDATDNTVKVAVVDSGVDPSHEDLIGRIDQSGYDYLVHGVCTRDTNGHGTEVAGCISALTNNKIGIAGVAGRSDVRVVPYCVMGSSGEGYVSDIVSALIEISKRDDIQIINLSLGGYDVNEAEKAACQEAYDNGKVIVASSGNENSHKITYPAAFPEVIAVGAVNALDERCDTDDWGMGNGSNYGKELDIVAPGDGIFTTVPQYYNKGELYKKASGTSFSAPIVAAACAVLKTKDPTLTPESIMNILARTADDVGALGKDEGTGYGVLRLDKAVNEVAKQEEPDPVHVTSIAFNKTQLNLTVGDSARLEVTVKPDDADNKDYDLISENTKIATVTDDGLVTAHAKGSVKITAVAKDGGITATCNVTVKEKEPEVVHVTGVTVNPSSATLTEGNTLQLSATVKPSNATDRSVSWSTSDKNVAVVDSNGYVKAMSSGIARIVAKTNDQGKTDMCYLVVNKKQVAIKSVTVSPKNTSLVEGGSTHLKATINPSDATDQELTWSSSDEHVATVDSSGYVRAISSGTARITVRTSDPNIFDICYLTVNPKDIAVESITVNPRSLQLEVGDTTTLQYKITPDNATNKQVIWESSDPEVATVSSNGIVRAYSAGKTTVKVISLANRNQYDSCSITIKEKSVPVTGVELNKTSLSLTVGGHTTLKEQVLPKNATNQEVTWRSTNSSVASVDDTGKVTALKAGTARIRVTTDDQKKTATCTVSVKNKTVKVTDVDLSADNYTLVKGANVKLSASVVPSNATNKKVSWTSSKPTVATVNSSGRIVAKNTGTTTITAASSDGLRKATCKVKVVKKSANVKSPIKSITMSSSTLNAKVGTVQKLTAKVTPNLSTTNKLTWKTSNKNVATVNSSGKVTFKKTGVVTITAVTVDPGITVSCRIVVKPKVSQVSVMEPRSSLTVGESMTLKATVQPTNAFNKNVTWKSSNSAVATVSTSGVVKAKKAGTATITVTSVDQKKKAQCRVIVKK